MTLDQHFAVTLDGKLVTVPSISFQQYPDGLSGSNGADVGHVEVDVREGASGSPPPARGIS